MKDITVKTQPSTLSDTTLLKTELANLIAERDELVHVVIPNLEAEYQLKIGFLEYEKFETQVSVNRLKRSIELAQAAINRGESVNLAKIEEILHEEFAEWEYKLKEHLNKVEAAKHHVKSLLSPEESREIATIYKKIVKMLHPDINPEAYEKNRDLWERAAEAYQNGNLEGLRVLLLLLEEETETPRFNEKYHEKMTAQLKDSIKRLIAEMQSIKSKPPYSFKERLNDENWAIKEQERLKQETGELKT